MSNNMQVHHINNKKYYLANDLRTIKPHLFKGCSTARAFADKHKLSNDKYIYARLYDKNKWVETDGSSRKFDKLFLRKKWFDEKYLSKTNSNDADDTAVAPDIIELDDNEKFFDNDGTVVDIEVRGERQYDKIFFRVSDITIAFNLKSLHRNILDVKSSYVKNKHYVYLFISGSSEKKLVKKLFLTYKGLLRVLFASNKNTADKFVDWASQTLFTCQMGTPVQKTNLVSNLLGVHPEAIKAVFNKSVNTLPCIYLFSIGLVKDLRKSLKIASSYRDNELVYKWGTTADIERRTKEHTLDFSKINGSKLELALFGFIDPQYIFEAETRVKHLIEGMNLAINHDKFEELAVIPKNKFKLIKEQYDMISRAYMGHIRELVGKIKEKDSEIILLKKSYEYELLKKDNDMLKKDAELSLIKKDLEIANLKLSKKK